MFRALFRRAVVPALVAIVAFSLGAASVAEAAGEENSLIQRIVKLEEQVAGLITGLAAEVLARTAGDTATLDAAKQYSDGALESRVGPLEARVAPLEGARVVVVTATASASGGTPASTQIETYTEQVPVYEPLPDGSGYVLVGYRTEVRTRTVYVAAVPAIATANAQCPSGKVALSGYATANDGTAPVALTESRFATSTGAAPTDLAGHTGWQAKASFATAGTVIVRAFCAAP